MKIAYLSNSYIPSKSANSIHVMKMCSAFAANGHEVTLIAKKAKDLFIDFNYYEYYDVDENFKIKLYNCGSSSFNNMLFSLKSSLFSKLHNFDLVYSRNLYSSFFSTTFLKKTIHESHSPENSTFISKLIFKYIYKKPSLIFITVISHSLKLIIQNEYNISKKIFVAHDGADFPKKSSIDLRTKQLNSDFNVVYIGHLYKGRGIDLIVRLAKLMTKNKFHIIGGNDKDLSYWKMQCKDLTNIIFYGFIEQKELQKYKEFADILIAPYMKKVSVSGGRGDTSKWMSPLKVFEYMAAQKPIIISDIPVLREILNDNSAIFCDPYNIQDWIDAIQKLKNDPEFSKKIALNSFKEFSIKYSWKSRANKLINLCK